MSTLRTLWAAWTVGLKQQLVTARHIKVMSVIELMLPMMNTHVLLIGIFKNIQRYLLLIRVSAILLGEVEEAAQETLVL
jgi:glucose dehydrogenase